MPQLVACHSCEMLAGCKLTVVLHWHQLQSPSVAAGGCGLWYALCASSSWMPQLQRMLAGRMLMVVLDA
jgi:hypothetical protein